MGVILEARDFCVTTTQQSNALRQKLSQLGSELIKWCDRYPTLKNLLRDYYVTRKNDPQQQWLGLYPLPIHDIEDALLIAPHIHLVLPQDGNDPWIGINIEFQRPREITAYKIDPHFPLNVNQAISAIRMARGAIIKILRKKVRDGNATIYEWDSLINSPVETDDITSEHIHWIYSMLTTDIRETPCVGYHWEAVLLVAYEYNSADLVAKGDSLEVELQGRIELLEPFLRFIWQD